MPIFGETKSNDHHPPGKNDTREKWSGTGKTTDSSGYWLNNNLSWEKGKNDDRVLRAMKCKILAKASDHSNRKIDSVNLIDYV